MVHHFTVVIKPPLRQGFRLDSNTSGRFEPLVGKADKRQVIALNELKEQVALPCLTRFTAAENKGYLGLDLTLTDTGESRFQKVSSRLIPASREPAKLIN